MYSRPKLIKRAIGLNLQVQKKKTNEKNKCSIIYVQINYLMFKWFCVNMYISDYVSNSLIIKQHYEWITYFVQRENKNSEYKKISSILYINVAWWNIHTLGIVFKCTRQTSYQYTEYLFLHKIQIHVTWTIKYMFILLLTIEYYSNTDSDIDNKIEGMNLTFAWKQHAR